MLAAHRLRGTWQNNVDLYIALTEFSKEKFIEGGLPREKIIVKPNFVDPDPGLGDGSGGFALFVGRLTEEKGVPTLLKAWAQMSEPLGLKILGDGPLRAQVQEDAARDARIEYLGRLPLDRVYDMMGRAGVLVFPSEWYEGLPRTIIESYAKGTPVIASRLGSMSELIDEGCTGWLFSPGDRSGLAERVGRALGADGGSEAIRRSARAEYELKYRADRNYEILTSAYAQVCQQAGTTNET
jgi:glycosyltransferase involved in cell wall biosynthesis